MSRRTSLDGAFASRNSATARRSSSCPSENAKFIWVLPQSGVELPRLTREAQHPLADDVALDLARTGVDRLRAARHELLVQVAEVVLAVAGLVDQHGVGAEHVHRGLAETAMPIR